ncbi:hypothetical protein WA158_006876 [Blastocystis sp. Blastoise]
MFASCTRSFLRSFGHNAGRKVVVIGAGGGIGQPLSLLLKSNPQIGDLVLYDLARTKGVACELSHIYNGLDVEGYEGPEYLPRVLADASVVVVPAGVPRKPGMTRDDLFSINAGIIYDLACNCAKYCPNAYVGIISNPVNSMVPLWTEVYKNLNIPKFEKRIFGITTLDTVRAKTFTGKALGVDPITVHIPVVGGHAGRTIIPLLSQVPGTENLTNEQLDAITQRIQFGGDEVVKNGGGSATLSMAFAGASFIKRLIAGIDGQSDVIVPAFINYETCGVSHFARQIEIGAEGIRKVLPIPKNLSEREQKNLEEAVTQLKKEIKKGTDFADSQQRQF